MHPARPEWGAGVVDEAQPTTHQGKTGQRLTVRFANHGRVTINTAVIPLRAMDGNSNMNNSSTQGWLGAIAGRNGDVEHELWALPEAMTDLFSNLQQRLLATLETFRFDNGSRGLFDWAVAQTGLTDPMTRYNRHELEQAYERFSRDRRLHLQDMVRQLKSRGDAALLNEALRDIRYDTAKVALQKAMR